jgi:hypothetical protein
MNVVSIGGINRVVLMGQLHHVHAMISFLRCCYAARHSHVKHFEQA